MMKKTCRSDANRPQRRVRRATTTVALLGAAFAWLMLGAAPGSAHAGLVASTPGAGARLDTAPRQVRLEFNEQIDPNFAEVRIRVNNRTVAVETQVDGARVTARPTSSGSPAAGNSRWQVGYRVVSSDGHPVTGSLKFVVTTPESDADPTQSATPSPAPTASTPDAATKAIAADPETAPQREGRDWGLIISSSFILVVALAAFTIPVTWVARKRSEDKRR